MTTMKEALEAFAGLAPGGVYPQVCTAAALPNSYIVLTVVDDRPELYAGDTDEAGAWQLRAAWYDRAGTTGHKAALRAVGRALGGTVLDAQQGYDSATHHYIQYQEFYFDESEDD